MVSAGTWQTQTSNASSPRVRHPPADDDASREASAPPTGGDVIGAVGAVGPSQDTEAIITTSPTTTGLITTGLVTTAPVSRRQRMDAG